MIGDRRVALEVEPSVRPAVVTSVCIVTRDRPFELGRCLAGLVDHLRVHARHPRIRVFDDASDPRASEACRALVSARALETCTEMEYVGYTEKRWLRQALIEGDVPADVVEFALFGSPVFQRRLGANRNAILLLTAGELSLSVDDDVEWRLAAPPEPRDGIGYFSGYDPSEYWFFSDRAATLAALRFVDVDLLGAHERLLGPIAAAPKPYGPDGRVVGTITGIAGDCGMDTPRWAWLSGPSWHRLTATAMAFQSAFRSREVLKVVDRGTVSDGRFCMAPCLAVDNRAPLPPFFPSGRNTDGVFGATLRTCFPDAYIGHLPVAVLHSPSPPREFAAHAMQRHALVPEVADLLGLCLRTLAGGRAPDGPVDRLRHVGVALRQIGEQHPDDLDAFLHQRLALSLDATLAEVDRIGRLRPGPPYWTEEIGAFAASLEEARARQRPLLPRNLLEGHEPAVVRRALGDLIRDFGRLLEWWPDMMRIAQTLAGARQRTV
jgi:hypothetical protein